MPLDDNPRHYMEIPYPHIFSKQINGFVEFIFQQKNYKAYSASLYLYCANVEETTHITSPSGS